jgi:hypothetical protein
MITHFFLPRRQHIFFFSLLSISMNGAPVADTKCMWGADGKYKCGVAMDYSSLAPGMTILAERSASSGSTVGGSTVGGSGSRTPVLESMANQRAFADAAPVAASAKPRMPSF